MASLPLARFQVLVRRGIREALRHSGGHAKSYEGRIRYQVELPAVLDPEDVPVYTLELDCYLLGPGRHYAWHARTEDDAFRVATADVTRWIRELDDDTDDDDRHHNPEGGA